MRGRKETAAVFCMLGISFLICACGKENGIGKDGPANAGTSEAENVGGQDISDTGTKKEKNAQGVEDLVRDVFAKEGEITLEEEYTMEVDYHVPEILLDSEGAKAINEKIKEDCQDVICLQDDDMPWWQVNYEAYLNGDILSVLLIKSSVMDGYTEYYAYNLDIKKGKELDQQELIETLSIAAGQGESPTEAVLRSLKKAAAYQCDQDIRLFFEAEYFKTADPDESHNMYGQCLLMRMETLQEDNINLELPMYLDEKGELSVAVGIYSMSGGGIYYEILKPLTTDTCVDCDLDFDEIYITYRDGKMTVCIEESDWTMSIFDQGNLEFGKEYEVHGIYKDYTDAAMITVVKGKYVVPAFVSEDGLVSYLDVYQCGRAGYFCMTEPVYGLTGIDAITEENMDVVEDALYNAVFERNAEFSRTVMGLYEGDGLGTDITYHTDAGTQYTEHYYLGYDMDDAGTFLYQDSNYDADLYFCYEGNCTYLGMDEGGMILSFELYDTETGEAMYGAFSECRKNGFNEQTEEWEEWADYIQLSGYDLFGPEHRNVRLDVSVG